MCDLRLLYCTKSEKENLLKLVSEVFKFRKKVFPTNQPQIFSQVTWNAGICFLALVKIICYKSKYRSEYAPYQKVKCDCK